MSSVDSMKYLMLIPDGMADWKVDELGGKTPLEYADTPNMDEIASASSCGLARTIPEGFEPGSDIANLTILGVDVRRYYTGRGPIEALARGVRGDWLFRCNLVYVENGIMVDYSGNRIENSEAKRVIEFLNREKEWDNVVFHPGVGFRNIASINGSFSKAPLTTPPHDITGEPIARHMPRNGELADLVREIIEWSAEVLPEVTDKANMVWLWSGGKLPDFPKIEERYGLRGAMISEVDLLYGIGKGLGMECIYVDGVTAWIDTNYRGLARAALKALKTHDFVLLHTEGIDEAGHEGDAELKVEAIEIYDEKIAGYILDRIDLEEVRVALLPDHPTPIRVRTHVAEPVPFAITGKSDGVKRFSEKECKKGRYGLIDGLKIMELFVS